MCNSTGVRRDQLESTCFFTYWVAGGNDSPPPRVQGHRLPTPVGGVSWAFTRGSSIPTENVFGSLGKLGEWLRTNELNKAYVGKKKCRFITTATSNAAAGGIWLTGWLVEIDIRAPTEVYGVGRAVVVGGLGRRRFKHVDRVGGLLTWGWHLIRGSLVHFFR